MVLHAATATATCVCARLLASARAATLDEARLVDPNRPTVVSLPRDRRRIVAVLRGRCPRCRAGPVFAGTFTMHERCPVCRLRFEREPGYFLGAMYVSYALSVPLLGSLIALVWLVVPAWSWLPVLAVAALLYLGFVPWLFRTARVVWMHVDRTVDPE